jgi:hypothetical protein
VLTIHLSILVCFLQLSIETAPLTGGVLFPPLYFLFSSSLLCALLDVRLHLDPLGLGRRFALSLVLGQFADQIGYSEEVEEDEVEYQNDNNQQNDENKPHGCRR